MRSRDEYIDFLKFVGLTMIMLAHVHPPGWVYELRSFDVPLMLFASGLAFSGRQIDDVRTFLCTRTARLIVPVYVFLTGYFLAQWLLPGCRLDATSIAGSYLLLNARSIGYVWVIKVFLLIMLATPALLRWNGTATTRTWVGAVLVLLAVLELSGLLLDVLKTFGLPLYYAYYETIQFALAYSIPFLCGLRVRSAEPSMQRSGLLLSALLLGLVMLTLYVQTGDAFHLSSRYKFSPRAAFMLYGLFMSMLLWTLRGILGWLSRNKVISFVGRHTLWIYLWHIPLVGLTRPLGGQWLLRLAIVWSLSLLVFSVQYALVCHLERRRPHPFFRYLKG